MKGFILILGLIGLVGCSDINVVKNNGLISENPDINGSANQKIEMIPYWVIWNADGTIATQQSRHQKFIDFLEMRSIVLSNAEKDLIRNDDPKFKVYLSLLYDGSLVYPGTPSANSHVSHLEYEIEVHIESRIITIDEGTFTPGLFLTFNETPVNITTFELVADIDFSLNEKVKIKSQSVMVSLDHSHSYHSLVVEHLPPSGGRFEILSIKNNRTKSVCEFYTGDILDQYCPFNF